MASNWFRRWWKSSWSSRTQRGPRWQRLVLQRPEDPPAPAPWARGHPPGPLPTDPERERPLGGGQLTLTNSVLRDSYVAALRIVNSTPTVQGNTFRDNNVPSYGSAISMDLASDPTLVDNTFVNNRVNGVLLDSGALPHDAAWH